MSNNVPLAELESKLGSLTELAGRFDKIRSAPSSLLQPVQYDHLRDLGGLYDPTARLKTAFADSSSFANALTSAEVQDALLFAENSNNADPSGVDVSAWRREKGPASSPPPLTSAIVDILGMESLQVPATFELPALLPGVRPVSISQLPTYIRSCNTLSRQHGRLLIHIWTPEDSRSATISDSPLLRVVIEDVLVAYINLGVRNGMQDEPLAVEFINVFGCREVKQPYLYSDYSVFQKITQYLTGIINSQPECSLQSIVSLLDSYQGLFLARCAVCDRVVSADSFVPAIARIWLPVDPKTKARFFSFSQDATEPGEWQSRHLTCLNHL